MFVCSQNRLRSPTAEQVFADVDGLFVMSAGTNNDADVRLTDELVEWADVIFVMESRHRSKVAQRHRKALGGTRIVCLDIPDDYALMEPALVQLLYRRVKPHLSELADA